MATTERPIAVGVFRDRSLARQAINELRHAGFRDDEISVNGHATRAGSLIDHLTSTFTGQGAEDGRLSDGLVSKGVSENDAAYYQQEVEAGHTVVVVESYGHWQEARDTLYRFGAYDASSHREEGERIIPVREEELRIHKQKVPTGEIVVRKEIITEDKTFTVPVTREELVIERRSGQSSEQAVYQGELHDEVLKDGGTLRILLHEEQVLIEKRPVVKEEILIGKRQIQETKHIEETVRREEAHIEREGDADIKGNEGEEISS
jgi:uncharacterized protein (TIGR02271 family)